MSDRNLQACVDFFAGRSADLPAASRTISLNHLGGQMLWRYGLLYQDLPLLRVLGAEIGSNQAATPAVVHVGMVHARHVAEYLTAAHHYIQVPSI